MISGNMLRVLITRLSAVGDCIHTMPVAAAIRARYPRAMIAWCTEPATEALVRSNPAVNRVVVVPKGWLGSPSAILQARRQLRALRCDVVIDCQSLTKSAMAGWLSGARTRIGFAPPQGRELAPWLHTVHVQRTAAHVVDSYLQLLRPLEIETSQAKFNMRPGDEALANTQRFMFHAGLDRGYAIVHPGTTWESKLWPAERYTQVARYLGRERGVRTVVLWGNQREQQWAEQIVAGSESHAVLAPKISLLELAAIAERATCYIGSDSGPLHLAAAMNVPCVALYGPTNPESCGPYGVGHFVIRKSISNSGDKRLDDSAMRAIEVDEVCRACEQVLALVSPPSDLRRAA